MDVLEKGFFQNFWRQWTGSRPQRPWMPAPRRQGVGGPHAPRLEREAAMNVASRKWSAGQAQSALDRSFSKPPTQVRAPAPGVRGFGGAGYSGGVSRELGVAPTAGWVSPPTPKPPKPPVPPMAKATSFGADPVHSPLSSGDILMDDKDLRELIARETTTPLGKAHFENILDGLDKIAKAWANPEARPEAEKLLKAWMADDQPELRKAMSGAWLQRARAVAAGAAGAARGAYMRGADKAQALGSRAGAAMAQGSKGQRAAMAAGRAKGEAEMASRLTPRSPVQSRGGAGPRGFLDSSAGSVGPMKGPGYRGFGAPTGAKGPIRHQPSMDDLQGRAIRNAGNNAAGFAGRAYAGGVARQAGNMSRKAYHGAAIGGGAAAAGLAAYGMSGRRRAEKADGFDADMEKGGVVAGVKGFAQRGLAAYRRGADAAGSIGFEVGGQIALASRKTGRLAYEAGEDAARRVEKETREQAAHYGAKAREHYTAASEMEQAAQGTSKGKFRRALGFPASGRAEEQRRIGGEYYNHHKTLMSEDIVAARMQSAREQAKGMRELGEMMGGAVRGNKVGRAIYHGAAATGALGVVSGGVAAGRALTDKERQQRRDAAKARWANRASVED